MTACFLMWLLLSLRPDSADDYLVLNSDKSNFHSDPYLVLSN